jgi:hypothetical protein
MTRHSPLALSDVQMQAIRQAAATVPRCHRPDFLHDIADRLFGQGEVSDPRLLHALQSALARYGSAP